MVLKPAIDVVWVFQVNSDSIELAERDVVKMVACLASVVGNVEPAVASEKDSVRILGVYPKSTDISKGIGEKPSWRPIRIIPGFSSVCGAGKRNSCHEDFFIVILVNSNLVKRIRRFCRQSFLARIHLLPGLAGVIAAIELSADSPFLRLKAAATVSGDLFLWRSPLVGILNYGVDDVRIFLVDVEPDASDFSGWKPAAKSCPDFTGVFSLVDSALRAAFFKMPGKPFFIICSGIEDIWIGVIDDEVNHTHFIIDIKNLLPGIAAVSCFENAALPVPGKEMTHGCHIDDVRIFGVDDDAGNMLRIAQAHVLPGLAAVQGFINAVPAVGAAGIISFAGPDPDDILV